ncbi:MAG: Tfp pilus assembly protein PilF [Candidatus Parabeggiatoa sp. nov. 1]|nr:MAG: Tfp pilus assembly protein PilF [Gammaproteobacteria bacterium]
MSFITIHEKQQPDDNTFQAELSFNNGTPYLITIKNPFSEPKEKTLQAYFEESLSLPFTNEVKFAQAAASLPLYGEDLFKQVFFKSHAYAKYRQSVQAADLEIEIVGSAAFHQLHWETLKDPKQAQPLALQHPITRNAKGSPPPMVAGQTSPTINVLLVVARPNGKNNVGHRTISQPLVESLDEAQLPVNIDILRPGTYRALLNHLETTTAQHGTGYYHVIHFDVHGAVFNYEAVQQGCESGHFLSQARYARAALQPYEGKKAFLFLRGDNENQADLMAAFELVEQVLAPHRIPIVVLNACQSAKPAETGLASDLMQAGAQTVLTMAYAVSVSATIKFMETLYTKLFESHPLATAIRMARLKLHKDKTRQAYFNQQIDLEDWLLPAVYQHQKISLPLRKFTPDEKVAYREQQAPRYTSPETQYGFVGRDLDVLAIENRLLSQCNVLLIQGMGGAGKTTLLHHLGAWWQTTHFVDKVFYFGYDEQAWRRQNILVAIAQQLMTVSEQQQFQSLSSATQQKRLAKRLRTERHLLILDNLESITGSPLAIPNTLASSEQQKLSNFLKKLVTGKTLVLLGSRHDEAWLAKETFGDNRYPLSGLDAEATSQLVDNIFAYHNARFYREEIPPNLHPSKGEIKKFFAKRKTTKADSADSPLPAMGNFEALQQLLSLLAGYPLALEVVLAIVAHQTPKDVLVALQADNKHLELSSEKNRESILPCIDYAYGHFSPATQQLILCLAPFAGVINMYHMSQYTERLEQLPILADLPFKQWDMLLEEATNRGLLCQDPNVAVVFYIQPIFPYLMRHRLHNAQPDVQQAINTAFRQHYEAIGEVLVDLLNSNKYEDKRLGKKLVSIEYDNLNHALELALAAQTSIHYIYWALSLYFETTQEHQQGLAVGEAVLARLANKPILALPAQVAKEFVKVMQNVAYRHLLLEQYKQAEQVYQEALKLTENLAHVDEQSRSELNGSAYHQLGIVAQEQRQWQRAEQYLKQALEIEIKFNNRYEQAGTYHQLGAVAKEQQQWQQAEQYLKKSLDIKFKLEIQHEKAGTYHALGVIAQKQAQWQLSMEYLITAFNLWAEFHDTHSITTYLLPSLARLYQSTNNEDLPAFVAQISNTTVEEARETLRTSAEKQQTIYFSIAKMLRIHPKKIAKAARSVFGTEAVGPVLLKAFRFLIIVGGIIGLIIGYFLFGSSGSLIGLVSGGVGLPLLVIILEIIATLVTSKRKY